MNMQDFNEALAVPHDGGRTRKGAPLVSLCAILGGWTLLRLGMWEPPTVSAEELTPLLMPPVMDHLSYSVVEDIADGAALIDRDEPAALRHGFLDRTDTTSPPLMGASYRPRAEVNTPEPQGQSLFAERAQLAASHQLVWSAAMAYLPMPRALSDALKTREKTKPLLASAATLTALAPFEAAAGKREMDRWSLDAWAFWRQDSGMLPARSLGRAPSYGASQAGAVLRYELQPESAHRPRAYARAYAALSDADEQEFAAGFSAKPIPSLPLRAHIEGRALRSGDDTEARMAGFVTTELQPLDLPAGLKGEAYAQAGYVTGDRATAFADGQVHVMREVADFDLARVELGGAGFAGAQKGASRVDIGPSMRVDLKLGDVPARLSVDWREQVAGDAQPDSGLAVTLSTRF
jgi:hypothetical protein